MSSAGQRPDPGSWEVVLRHAEYADAQGIAETVKAAWHARYDGIMGVERASRDGDVAYAIDNLRGWIRQASIWRGWHSYLVAERDGHVVGVLQASIEDRDQAVIFMLYVHPQWQRRGIGTALIDAFAGEHWKVTSLRLEVLKDNSEAIAFYQRCGFEVFGETSSSPFSPGSASVYMDKTVPRRPRAPFIATVWSRLPWTVRAPLGRMELKESTSPWSRKEHVAGPGADESGAGPTTPVAPA